ncbi:MAG: DUF5908 family protein [Balneolaceae bacterium]
MPIEIRELVIKAVINDTSQQNRREESTGGPETDTPQQFDKLEETVQQVLEVIRENKNER